MEGHQDSIGAAFARGALAIGYAFLGEFEKAEAASRHATELAAKGDLIAQLDALIADGFVRSLKGELDAAVPIATECFKRSEETGASACMVVSSWILGDAFHRQGRFEEARDVLTARLGRVARGGPEGLAPNPPGVARLGGGRPRGSAG